MLAELLQQVSGLVGGVANQLALLSGSAHPLAFALLGTLVVMAGLLYFVTIRR